MHPLHEARASRAAVSVKALSELIGLVVVLIGATVASVTYFETSRAADAKHEQLAADQEAGRLDTELKLIELELKMLRAIANPSPADLDRIRYLEKRQELIEARLLQAQQA